MTTTISRSATRPPPLTLDNRLALVALTMDDRLAQAAVAFEVNTHHIPAAPPIEITIPHLPQTAVPCPHSTPIAALLHRARIRIETDGWCRNALHDDQGAICPVRAIRLEAASRSEADDACALLLERIQRDFRNAATVPSWNAQQPSAAPVLLVFEQAAELADSRSQ
ncbi:hypothetical protein N4G70_28975 [Streptomyces sp. ASQP_92]|uniref:DUF6197 family protein n=1 Tax=Streptomyces sp. ASQP_92 TaxID=2979116 RepID=UPI0021C12BB1|nr:hypothetical protein [Streptomyces sp. ASQP_92]MCT9092874.1 hypothetical protein [Streptomyces sp. ASQP_92]